MKRLSVVVVGVGAIVLAFLVLADAPEPRAADHVDSPSVEGTPLTDLSDLYVWMSSDASDVNLVMTVNPDYQGTTAAFDPNATYRFNIEASDGSNTEDHTIDCTYSDALDPAQVTCAQAGTSNIHVVSVDTVVAPSTGNLQAFAGVRDDAFFFNFAGFAASAAAVEQAAADLEANEHGCPELLDGTAEALVQCLSTACDVGPGDSGNAAAQNDFAGQNVLAIVVSLPKADLDAAGNAPTTLKVWASTLDGSDNQLDRVGRPAISTALIDPFNQAANHDELKNSYNTADDPASWATMFADDLEATLAVLDALDSTAPDSQ